MTGCVGDACLSHGDTPLYEVFFRKLQLALDDNPAAKAYQQAMFEQGQPAAMFFTDDVRADHDRMTARGAVFTMPPTATTGSTIAMLDDTCGNRLQVTQLMRWQG